MLTLKAKICCQNSKENVLTLFVLQTQYTNASILWCYQFSFSYNLLIIFYPLFFIYLSSFYVIFQERVTHSFS